MPYYHFVFWDLNRLPWVPCVNCQISTHPTCSSCLLISLNGLLCCFSWHHKIKLDNGLYYLCQWFSKWVPRTPGGSQRIARGLWRVCYKLCEKRYVFISIYIYIFFYWYFFFCLLYQCFLHWWLSLSFIVICCGELPNVPNRFKVCTYIFVHTIHEEIFVKSIYILLCQNALQFLFKGDILCNHVWVWLSTCDVRSGTFSKRLVTANHTHTWWYYVPLKTIVVLALNVWSIK